MKFIVILLIVAGFFIYVNSSKHDRVKINHYIENRADEAMSFSSKKKRFEYLLRKAICESQIDKENREECINSDNFGIVKIISNEGHSVIVKGKLKSPSRNFYGDFKAKINYILDEFVVQGVCISTKNEGMQILYPIPKIGIDLSIKELSNRLRCPF